MSICQFTQCLNFYNVLLQKIVIYIWYIITGIAQVSYNGKHGYNINLCSVSSYFLRFYNDWVLIRMKKRVWNANWRRSPLTLVHFVLKSIIFFKTRTDRQVTMFHYTTWSDHGVADPLSLVVFHRHVIRATANSAGKYTVVHCRYTVTNLNKILYTFLLHLTIVNNPV